MTLRLILILSVITTVKLTAQTDSLFSKLDTEMDFRFRVEQDWDSQKSNGTFRDDRSRLRYRFRIGATYNNEWYSFGLRVRTGQQNKQQDPQLTLGKGLKEFGTLPIGFEKIFFQGNWNTVKIWAGKNTYPFEKNNELFWSDNVFPEGISIEKQLDIKSQFIKKIKLTGAHFIIAANDGSFRDDSYFQALQTTFITNNEKVTFFPTIYSFRNIPNIPDGDHSFLLNYTILHLGTRIKMLNQNLLRLDFDYYQNIENYNQNANIPEPLQSQKSGFVIGLQYGKLKNKKDWLIQYTYANLERYSILDFMAQNDWARWDYSSNNSPDGRLSNFKGSEITLGYSLSQKVNLVMKYYNVEQLIPYGITIETGQRIRLDLNAKI